MAKLSIALILAISCFLASTLNVYARKQAPYVVVEEETSFVDDFWGGREKLLKLELYVQDFRIGHENATVVEVAKAAGVTDESPFNFGSVHVVDDLVTEGPGLDSQPLGRLQGLTTNADISTFGIAMNLNFYFTVGKLAGSTLCILGRNQVLDDQRELAVVGGSGVFRFARGYAIQTSYSTKSMNAPSPALYVVLKYTIYTTYNSRFNVDAESFAQM